MACYSGYICNNINNYKLYNNYNNFDNITIYIELNKYIRIEMTKCQIYSLLIEFTLTCHNNYSSLVIYLYYIIN